MGWGFQIVPLARKCAFDKKYEESAAQQKRQGDEKIQYGVHERARIVGIHSHLPIPAVMAMLRTSRELMGMSTAAKRGPTRPKAAAAEAARL
jgi:hypothetical protein